MSNDEVSSLFRGAANRLEQIGIIRELTLLPRAEIFHILVESGSLKETDSDFNAIKHDCCKVKHPEDASDDLYALKPKKSTAKPKTSYCAFRAAKQNEVAHSNMSGKTVGSGVLTNMTELQAIKTIKDLAYSGYNIDGICGATGMEAESVMRLCKKHNFGIDDAVKLYSTKKDAKESIVKAKNYIGYIRTYVECGNVDAILDVLDKQSEAFNEAIKILG